MIALIQRVSNGSVSVDDTIVGEISTGIVLLLGVEKNDTIRSSDTLLEKVLGYRIFSDEEGKMNLSLRDIEGELLVISQFTLAADTHSGKRPSFSGAKPPQEAKELYEYFSAQAHKQVPTQTGVFAADMKVSLTNDGPVTFRLQVT